jgi:hypothetical protein
MSGLTNWGGRSELFSGNAAADNALLFTASDVWWADTFHVMSTVGTVDVEVSLDGTNWTAAAIAMQDMGVSASGTFVLVTAAGKVYKFTGNFHSVCVRQAGATAATAHMRIGCA